MAHPEKKQHETVRAFHPAGHRHDRHRYKHGRGIMADGNTGPKVRALYRNPQRGQCPRRNAWRAADHPHRR
jgi:hypothetical protein